MNIWEIGLYFLMPIGLFAMAVALYVVFDLKPKSKRKSFPRFIEPKPELMFIKPIPRTEKIRTILGTRKVIIGYDYVIRRVGDE